MAKRGRKPLMRVQSRCVKETNNEHYFDMTITRDGMAGYGYCTKGHFNMKFIKPPEEALYLWLTKDKLTGGNLTGIETKLIFEAFEKWCEGKKIKIQNSFGRGRNGGKQITLEPKILYKPGSALYPDFSSSWEGYRNEVQRYLHDDKTIQKVIY